MNTLSRILATELTPKGNPKTITFVSADKDQWILTIKRIRRHMHSGLKATKELVELALMEPPVAITLNKFNKNPHFNFNDFKRDMALIGAVVRKGGI